MRDAARIGVVQGSLLGFEIDVSTFRSVQDTFRRSKVYSRHFLGAPKVFYTLFASRLLSIFQTLRNPAHCPWHAAPPPQPRAAYGVVSSRFTRAVAFMLGSVGGAC